MELNQSSMNSAYGDLFSEEDEKVVSKILLDLPDIVFESKRCRFLSVCWLTKRKRSVLELDDYDTATTTSSPVSMKRSKCKNVDTTVCAAADSPCTTLAFPSSGESDEHKSSKQSNSKKRTREELLGIIDGLNHQQELLKGEIHTMRYKHFKLSNTNKELKAKKKELSFGQKIEKKPQLKTNGGGIEHYQYQTTMFAPQVQQFFQLGPYDQRTPMGTPPNCNGMGLVNETCLLGASSQPLNLRKMLKRFDAAEARRTRMVKIKEAKNQRRSQSL